MIVTAYYDIYNKPERFDQYSSWFSDLANSGLSIMLFTDPSLVDKFNTLPKTVKVVSLRLNECELYSIAFNSEKQLPLRRNAEKDTKEYLSLMNNKIEFIKRAAELCDDNNLIWMDYGILKIIKDKGKVISKLKEIDCGEYDKIIIPGCWKPIAGFSDDICWRFCGGLCLCSRKDIDWFYNKSKELLEIFCKNSKLTWEVNLWCMIENEDKEKRIKWYYSDHNDGMILNF